MTGYLNTSHLQRGKDKAVLGKEAAETPLRRGRCSVFGEFFTVTIFWSVLRQSYKVACFVSLCRGLRVALSDVDVLRDCFCAAGGNHGPAFEVSLQIVITPRPGWECQTSSWISGATIFFSTTFGNIQVWNQETCDSTCFTTYQQCEQRQMTYSLSLQFPTQTLPQRNVVCIQ